MAPSLGDFVGLPAFVGFVLVGMATLLAAASLGGVAGRLLALLIAVVVVVGGLALLFLTWIHRLNEDIDSNRPELRRDLDELVEDAEE